MWGRKCHRFVSLHSCLLPTPVDKWGNAPVDIVWVASASDSSTVSNQSCSGSSNSWVDLHRRRYSRSRIEAMCKSMLKNISWREENELGPCYMFFCPSPTPPCPYSETECIQKGKSLDGMVNITVSWIQFRQIHSGSIKGKFNEIWVCRVDRPPCFDHQTCCYPSTISHYASGVPISSGL